MNFLRHNSACIIAKVSNGATVVNSQLFPTLIIVTKTNEPACLIGPAKKKSIPHAYQALGNERFGNKWSLHSPYSLIVRRMKEHAKLWKPNAKQSIRLAREETRPISTKNKIAKVRDYANWPFYDKNLLAAFSQKKFSRRTIRGILQNVVT